MKYQIGLMYNCLSKMGNFEKEDWCERHLLGNKKLWIGLDLKMNE